MEIINQKLGRLVEKTTAQSPMLNVSGNKKTILHRRAVSGSGEPYYCSL